MCVLVPGFAPVIPKRSGGEVKTSHGRNVCCKAYLFLSAMLESGFQTYLSMVVAQCFHFIMHLGAQCSHTRTHARTRAHTWKWKSSAKVYSNRKGATRTCTCMWLYNMHIYAT